MLSVCKWRCRRRFGHKLQQNNKVFVLLWLRHTREHNQHSTFKKNPFRSENTDIWRCLNSNIWIESKPRNPGREHLYKYTQVRFMFLLPVHWGLEWHRPACPERLWGSGWRCRRWPHPLLTSPSSWTQQYGTKWCWEPNWLLEEMAQRGKWATHLPSHVKTQFRWQMLHCNNGCKVVLGMMTNFIHFFLTVLVKHLKLRQTECSCKDYFLNLSKVWDLNYLTFLGSVCSSWQHTQFGSLLS